MHTFIYLLPCCFCGVTILLTVGGDDEFEKRNDFMTTRNACILVYTHFQFI